MKRVLFGMILTSLQSLAFASPAVVDIAWISKNQNDDSLLIVDLRPRANFEYAHIKGSSFTDYNAWRQPNAQGIESMLPSKAHLEQLLSQMGATPEKHIVLVPMGDSADGLASATRIYWTLEQIGHAKKSILDGGIIAYANARLPLVRGPSTVKTSQYKITNMRSNQINADSIHNDNNLNLLDVRSKAEYLGIYRGAPDERAGTIPDAQSLPYDWFTQNGTGRFAEKENIELLLGTLNLNKERDTVVFCHTGHRASLSWFVLHEILEMDNTILYDASTREWARRSDLPITQKLEIKH